MTNEQIQQERIMIIEEASKQYPLIHPATQQWQFIQNRQNYDLQQAFNAGAHFALSNTQSDAVEFSDWCEGAGYKIMKDKSWYSLDDKYKLYTTSKLYDLFLFDKFAANIPIVGAVYIYNNNAYTKDELYELFKTERNG